MAPTTGRRSRTIDSDDESEESRAGTPTSTARNDSKRARRSMTEPQTSSRDSTPEGEDLEVVSKTRSERRTPAVELDVKKPKQIYQPGAIVRVKLTNFVTYTSAEFRPGPGLNMVIGPNGTGKSTLVCAICLGLGWGTQHLGRAKDASEFVKHGTSEATIEIELQRKDTRRNPIFIRKIKKDGNKSTFFLNDKPTTPKIIQQFARSFSIQIDNLCQFLPQDKVVEFAAMTPVELLRSTQQAAAPPEMLQWHEDLKKLSSAQKQKVLESRSDKEQLQNLQNRQDLNRVDMERMKERAETEQRREWMEMCRPVAQYLESRDKFDAAKAKKEQLARQLNELKAQLRPVLKKVAAKEEYVKQVKLVKEERELAVASADKLCRKHEDAFEKLDKQMTECDTNFEAEKKNRTKYKEDLRKAQRKITEYEKKMEQPPEPFDARLITDQIQAKTDRKRELSQQAAERKAQLLTLSAQSKERIESIKQLNQKLVDLDTQEGQQQSKLERESKEAAKAWDWIRKNPNLFEKEVFGPPIVSCSLKDPKLADAIESFFQYSDFRSFTCQTRNDYRVLQHELFKKLKLHDVSIRTCPLTSLETFRSPVVSDRLRQIGFQTWAIDQIEGPPTVLANLCSEKFLHRNAIFSRDISDGEYEEIVASGISSFTAGKTNYQITRRAEYGAAGTSSKTKDIKNGTVWTSQTVDVNAKVRLQREIGELNMEIATIKEEFDKLKAEAAPGQEEHNQLEQEIQGLRDDKDRKQTALTEYNKLPTLKAQQEEKLAAAQENLSELRTVVEGILKEKDILLVRKTGTAILIASSAQDLKEKLALLLESEIWLLEAQNDRDVLRAQNEGIRQTLQEKEIAVGQAAEDVRIQRKAGEAYIVELKRINAIGERMSEEGEDGLRDLITEMTTQRPSIADVEAEIDSLTARLTLTDGVGGNVVKDYEDREQRIQKLRARLDDAKRELDDCRHAIQEIRENWEPQLDELVGRISEKFGESFARIGCAGEVVVFKASSADNDADDLHRTDDADEGNGLDFANWAIHVSVRFRENEPLSLLDAHRQSGGERAVSTIFYLMALQSLSRAPFRVVDEINQGMDPRNERMVHGRMVDIATPRDGDESGGSQYFLVTPKLLSGLKYRRGMTVLCIVSGENMPPAIEASEEGKEVEVRKGNEVELVRQWQVNFSSCVKRARALGLSDQASGVGAGGRRVDSGIGLGSSFVSADMNDFDGRVRSRTVSIEG